MIILLVLQWLYGTLFASLEEDSFTQPRMIVLVSKTPHTHTLKYSQDIKPKATQACLLSIKVSVMNRGVVTEPLTPVTELGFLQLLWKWLVKE